MPSNRRPKIEVTHGNRSLNATPPPDIDHGCPEKTRLSVLFPPGVGGIFRGPPLENPMIKKTSYGGDTSNSWG